MVKAIAGLIQKLQTHNSVTANTPHGPTSWSALWAYPAPEGGKAANLPVLVELPDMHEEEIDVEEACDAGLVDREDLVNEKGSLDCMCLIPCNSSKTYCIYCILWWYASFYIQQGVIDDLPLHVLNICLKLLNNSCCSTE